MIEQKKEQKAAKKAKEAERQKSKRAAAKERVREKKYELLEIANQQLIHVSDFDYEAFKSEWLRMRMELNDVNSIIAIIIVANSNRQYSCILLSLQTKFKEKRVIAGNWIDFISCNGLQGKALLSCIKHNHITYYLSGYKYEIVETIIVNQDAFKKRLNSLGDRSAEYIKENTPIIQNNRILDKSKRVYVYFRLTNSCMRNGHEIENVTAKTTNVKNNQPISVNVFHCKQCKKYFINYEALQKYIAKGLYPALQYSFDRVDDGMLKDASELMLYGYNVREGNLTQFERRRILEWIIDSGLLTKAEIIRDLQFKVRYNGNKAGNERARQKWLDDIQFVSQYTRGNNKEINATFIYKDS